MSTPDPDDTTEADSTPKPDKWTDLLRPSYGYPETLREDATEGLSGRKARKSVRRAKKDWRREDADGRREFVRGQRDQEPPSSEGRLGILVLLALIVAVVVGGGLVRSCSANNEAAEPTPSVTTSAQPSASAEPTGESPSASPTPVEPSATATTAPEVAPVVPQDPDAIAVAWATAWHTYSPTEGDNEGQRLDRIAALSSSQLVDSLSSNDETSLYYDTERMNVTVQAVVIEPMPEGAAPVDTDLRMTRRITVTTTTSADPGTVQGSSYDLTIERADSATSWLVTYVADVVAAHD